MGNRALGFTVDQENTIWEMWRRGDSLSATGRSSGRVSLRSAGSCVNPAVSGRSHVVGEHRISRPGSVKRFPVGSPPVTVLGRSPTNSEDPRPRSLGRSPATAAANTIGRPRRMPQRMSARAALKSRLSLPGIFCRRLSQGS